MKRVKFIFNCLFVSTDEEIFYFYPRYVASEINEKHDYDAWLGSD